MKYHKLTLYPDCKTINVAHGTLLSDILSEYNLQMPCAGRGVCGNCKVRVIKGSVAKNRRHKAVIERKHLDDSWYLACMSRIEDDIVIELPSNDMLINPGVTNPIAPCIESRHPAGIAVDLGSTTIVAQLIDLSTQQVIASSEGINPQTSAGADIISRIAFAMKSPSHAQSLTDMTRKCIGDHIYRLLHNHIHVGNITGVIIAGNTAMHHFFAGLDVERLSCAPFCSLTNGSYSYSASQLGWDMLQESCKVELLPNISHFVGSDILCGIQACGIADSDEWQMLIDLGTNGEIALGCRDSIFCTSTAAGPAFEGLNISCGMRASAGAVYAIEHEDEGPKLLTVAGDKPRGFCGSGVIEAIEYLLSSAKIDFTGAFIDSEAELYSFAPDVYISIQDIREFQLAKAALSAGVELLLKEAGIEPLRLKTIYLTGGMGYHINLAKMQALGLFKDFEIGQFCKIVNSSLSGACANLRHTERNRIPEILNRIKFCALESDINFQEIFCREMFFSPNFDI